MTRTYVITGAASGIGAATAQLLAGEGYRVIGVDRRDADVSADLSTAAGRVAAVTDVERITGGQIDAVIASAGTSGLGATDVQVDYFGAVATLEGLRPMLARADAPSAVAIASFALLLPVNDALVEACLAGDEERAVGVAVGSPPVDPGVVYASAKRAIARWVRREAPTASWAGARIPLNAVAPGITRTPMTAPMLADAQVARGLMDAVPMPLGGIAEPSAVASVLAFLASEDVRSVTGQVVFVDGGADCVTRGDDVFPGSASVAH